MSDNVTVVLASEIRSYLPVMEDRETEGLSLRVSPQVCFETEGVDGRNKGLDCVQR